MLYLVHPPNSAGSKKHAGKSPRKSPRNRLNLRFYSNFYYGLSKQDVSSMMSVGSLVSTRVLCSIAIIKNGDKNLVDGRTQFNVKSEILSLDFRVDLKSSYICKSCLGKLKKRRALLSNLRDVNASLRQIYSSSSNGASSEESDTRMTTKTCSRALFESDVQPTKRVALQDGRSP